MASWGGDGGFWLFQNARDAVDAAFELHGGLARAAFAADAVRIAIGSGRVTYHEGQYDGDVMNLVARIQKQAKTGLRIALDSKVALQVTRLVKLDDGHDVAPLDAAYRERKDQFFIVEARVMPPVA